MVRHTVGWGLGLGLFVLGLCACRPLSYETNAKVYVPISPPSDGPDAAPGPRTRVLEPADEVEVYVPYEEVLPRGVNEKSPRDR